MNGKNEGRKRMVERGPNISRAKSSSVALRSAMVMCRSTASPSTWWNIGEWVESARSRRYTLPGMMMRTGGRWAFMARICTGEVWVRSSVSGDR